MIQGLKLINLPPASPLAKEPCGDAFILKTCQRTMIIGHNIVPLLYVDSALKETQYDVFNEEDAYLYLLETICGLKSKVLAENEVTGQFKDAYLEYLAHDQRNPLIMNVLEKLFKDAKEVRSQYLYAVGQQSYAGLSRQFLKSKKNSGRVLLVGSGKLTRDLIKLLDKNYELFVTARNEQKIKELLKEYPDKIIKTVSWLDYSAYETFELIVNTIGAETILFNENFFKNWSGANGEVFVDLGSPSVLKTNFTQKQGLYRLPDVFAHANYLNEQKDLKVKNARAHIEKLVIKRKKSFSLNYPFGWEDLQFV
ncbi:hypothetical protein HBN50_09225 [Halobacteriovorax sp. GB3]|uniref:hypothetical protein n=1 Tax=Halobacteriovorax sp. GB3 TaxID=2719615 RepID=UPI002361183F|nr:hypothetical protein [Halobacteriovorax sp. GB3]MDD0853279.1 hypothetical protein [Halobacteriovorax sp. GB3]